MLGDRAAPCGATISSTDAFVDAHTTGADDADRGGRLRGRSRAPRTSPASTAADIAAFAEELASIRPAFIRIGWGLERNRNGGSSFRSVLALPVLTGQLGVLGRGDHVEPQRSRRLLAGGPRRKAAAKVNMNQLGTELPAIAAVLFVQGSNPAVTAPRQQLVLEGLARDDLFTVVHDQVLTDTALYADVVLPATTHFEADDLAGSYGSFTRQRVAAVIDAGRREPHERRGRCGARGASRSRHAAVRHRSRCADDRGSGGRRASARGRGRSPPRAGRRGAVP